MNPLRLLHLLRRPRAAFAAPIAIVLLAVCAGPGSGTTAAAPPPSPASDFSPQDTTGIPAGLGSLHQEDISISTVQNGLRIRAMPLDEGVIRTLAPDSYNTLLRQRESRRADIDAIKRRTGNQTLSLWMVSYFNQEQGEAQISPRDAILTNQGRDFKPLDVLGMSPGFGDNRVKQSQVATCILVFDGAVNVLQPLTITFGPQTGGSNWASVVQRVEGERARIRSRAARGGR